MINKSSLIKRIASDVKIQLPYGKTAAVIDTFLNLIKESLLCGESVKILEFGTFMVVERQAKRVIDIKTREKIWNPPYKAPFFKASQILRKAIKENA